MRVDAEVTGCKGVSSPCHWCSIRATHLLQQAALPLPQRRRPQLLALGRGFHARLHHKGCRVCGQPHAQRRQVRVIQGSAAGRAAVGRWGRERHDAVSQSGAGVQHFEGSHQSVAEASRLQRAPPPPPPATPRVWPLAAHPTPAEALVVPGQLAAQGQQCGRPLLLLLVPGACGPNDGRQDSRQH